MKRLLAAAAILVLSSTAAQASTTFDFTSGTVAYTSGNISYSAGGIGLDVSSGNYTGGNVVDTSEIGQINGAGLVIKSWSGDDHEIDGDVYNDVAVFQFDQNVTLESVSFNFFEGDDDFAFFFDVGNDGSLNLIDGDIDANPLDYYDFTGIYLLNGDLFGIGALAYNDDFKIASVTVSAIPLPAAFPLYAAGMAVLGFMGWRRKRRLATSA